MGQVWQRELAALHWFSVHRLIVAQTGIRVSSRSNPAKVRVIARLSHACKIGGVGEVATFATGDKCLIVGSSE